MQTNTRNFKLKTFVILSLATVACAAQAAGTYNVVDLGAVAGHDSSNGLDINESGNAAGYSFLAPSSSTRAFLWQSGPGAQALGNPAAASNKAFGLNDLNDCVGSMNVGGNDIAHYWKSGSPVLNLGTLGGLFSSANAINNSQVITGTAYLMNTTSQAYRWTQGTGMVGIGTMGGASSSGVDINDNGYITGSSQVVGNATRHAFRWHSSTGFTDIGLLGTGNFATGLGINDAGFVCGYGNTTANGSTYSGFFWTPALGKVSIGSLYPNGDYDTRAFGVNSYSQVVGWSWLTQNGTSSHAFIWTQQEGMDDLNSLIPANSGWLLSRAAAINDNGEIVGTGTFNGKARAFKLVPATCTISGRVIFGDFVGSYASQALTIEVRNPGSTVALETQTIFTDAAGHYSFETSYKGTYDIAMKGPHWLRKKAASINTMPQFKTVSFTLINGDCDNDNEVGISDYAQVSFAYNSSLGDANYLPSADLDGDLSVDIADYAILSAHYGMIGND